MATDNRVDPLLDRILYDCKLSAGTMPIAIVVKDAAEKARGLALLKGRHNNQVISFITEAEAGPRGVIPPPAKARKHG